MPFDTPLSDSGEQHFQRWKQAYAPRDSGEDYDLRGAYKAGITPDPLTGHWPDTFKKPSHPTFSDQSIYSSLTGTRPGTWKGETYTPMPPMQRAPQTPQEMFDFINQPRPGYRVLRNPQQEALNTVTNAIHGQRRPWGFHEPGLTVGEAVGPIAQGAWANANEPKTYDPTGMAGTLGRAGRFGRVPDLGQDLGGFQASIRDIRHAMGVPTPNYYKVEAPGGFEAADRSAYLGNIQGNNQMADAMAQGIHGPNALPYLEAQNQYTMMSDMQKAAMDKTLRGRLALQGDLIRQSQMTSGGGGVPSEAMMSRFGFGQN